MAGRRQNVGPTDRIIRAFFIPFVAGAAVWLFYSLPREPTVLAGIGILGVLAFILGLSAVLGTCGIYSVLDVNTCKCEPEYGGGDRWG
ncbi:MAG: protein of unknown function (DUF2892) [Haloquadratum walsbyi J07HQW1]|uniref:Inner membrane protein YgaP-like transmembrane domain-containing protein n=1 Tax=Haloquadratum walsbyi J07HQW1 TaxID=1238424 RepID=U1PEW5_9EURY|nr:MAG: protein of unknown function (DUF2892) [Haloquadratum walsbyi J07HQW1]